MAPKNGHYTGSEGGSQQLAVDGRNDTMVQVEVGDHSTDAGTQCSKVECWTAATETWQHSSQCHRTYRQQCVCAKLAVLKYVCEEIVAHVICCASATMACIGTVTMPGGRPEISLPTKYQGTGQV